jgi:uncharacterized membrane protein
MVIKRWFVAIVLGFVVCTPFQARAEEFAENPPYSLGRVTIIFREVETEGFDVNEITQHTNVHMITGPDAGTDQLMDYTVRSNIFEQQKLEEGDMVIAVTGFIQSSPEYVILDKFRIPGVMIVFCAFVLLAILFAGIRGITSMFGLGASLAVLAFGVVPAIMSGHNPLVVCLIGSGVIAVVSILPAHGFHRRSGIALVATLLTLIGGVLFSLIAVALAKLSGSGTEEAIYLQLGSLPSLDLRGLLLGGMIIGTLGVLDDVTTTQVAAVEEIGIADPTLSAKELYTRGLRIGREHIAALVNTLALAYAGASFPLFLLFSIQGGPPLWAVLNAEYIMEEVVRAIVGGASLVIAVPISTALAAYYFSRHHR